MSDISRNPMHALCAALVVALVAPACVDESLLGSDAAVAIDAARVDANADAMACFPRAPGDPCETAADCCGARCHPTYGCRNNGCFEDGIDCSTSAECCSGVCTPFIPGSACDTLGDCACTGF